MADYPVEDVSAIVNHCRPYVVAIDDCSEILDKYCLLSRISSPEGEVERIAKTRLRQLAEFLPIPGFSSRESWASYRHKPKDVYNRGPTEVYFKNAAALAAILAPPAERADLTVAIEESRDDECLGCDFSLGLEADQCIQCDAEGLVSPSMGIAILIKAFMHDKHGPPLEEDDNEEHGTCGSFAPLLTPNDPVGFNFACIFLDPKLHTPTLYRFLLKRPLVACPPSIGVGNAQACRCLSAVNSSHQFRVQKLELAEQVAKYSRLPRVYWQLHRPDGPYHNSGGATRSD